MKTRINIKQFKLYRRFLMTKKITMILALIALSLTLFQGAGEAAGSEASVKDGVFIHISSGPDYPQRVLMALKMAEIMSADKDVLVYFDIKGVEVVLKESQDITCTQFPSSKTQLKALIDKGVKVEVCPTCLQVAGKQEKDVMEGVKIANKDDFFNFTKGRILTLDY
jgi:predicted peroxiredoxin